MASQGLVERHTDGAGGGAGGEPADVTARRRGEARWVGVLVLKPAGHSLIDLSVQLMSAASRLSSRRRPVAGQGAE